MIKVGFNTLVWTAVVSDAQLPLLDRLKQIGYDGVEVFIGAPDEKAYKRFGDHARNLGLGVTSVFVVGKDENPVDPSPAVRQKALDRIKWGIDRAHDMGASLFAGPMHSAHSVFTRQAPQDIEYTRAAEVLRAAGDHAEQAGIMLGLEALNRFESYLCNTMVQLKRLVDETGHQHVKAMYDTHHANIEEKDHLAAIRHIAPVLTHVHISENDRGTPGSGHIQWDENFSALADIKYSGWMTIEAFSRNDPDFANAIGVWREYDEPWEIAAKGYDFIKAKCVQHGL